MNSRRTRNPERNTRNVCECGTPKRAAATACARCLALDGHTSGEADLINVLRNTGPRTLLELAAETGRLPRSVHQTLSRFVKRGRVLKRERGSGGQAHTYELTTA